MKNKKRLLCGALAACMCLGVTAAAGCGQKTTEDDGKVVMTYLTMPSAKTTDLKKVEAAINDITQEDIGVTVELYPIGIMEQSKYTTLVAGGTRLDLMCTAFNDPTVFSSVGIIQKLTEDDVKTYAPTIAKYAEEDNMPLYSKDAKGNIVALCTVESQLGIGGSYVIRKSDLEAVGLADKYTDQTKITYSDLDTIFAAVKKQFPDSYPSGQLSDVSGYFIAHDNMGTNTKRGSGVLNLSADITSTTVVNYYETAEFKQYADKMAEWQSKGYIHPDAATTEQSSFSLFSAGTTRGTYIDCWLNLRDEYSQRAGEEVVQLQLMDPYFAPAGSSYGIPWAVGGTSKSKASALKLLNKIVEDKNLSNLLQWGIEGEHFKVLDEEAGVIDFADGVTASTTGFYNTLGLYGDKRDIYQFLTDGQTVADIKAQKDANSEISAKAVQRTSPAAGFLYDSSSTKTKIAAIENVIDTHLKSISVGKGNYNAFISALKAAGIDSVIADKQAQFDAWRNAG